MRTFIALPLPEAVRTSLATLQHELATSQADVTWVRADQLHVTLKFLGELAGDQPGQVEERIRRVGTVTQPFLAQLAQLGAFPSWRGARIIWVGFGAGADPMCALAAQVDQCLAELGMAKESRPFSAHVTIGRVRSTRELRRLVERIPHVPWHPPEPWTISTMTLYESRLSPAGPAYSVLADVPLGRSAEAG